MPFENHFLLSRLKEVKYENEMHFCYLHKSLEKFAKAAKIQLPNKEWDPKISRTIPCSGFYCSE